MLRLCLFWFRIIAMQTQPLKHTGYVIFDSWIVAFKHGNKWSIPNTLCVNFASFSYRIYFDSWFFCVVSMWNCHMHCVSCPNQFDCSWCAPESCTDQNANILHAEKFHGKMKGFMYIVHIDAICRCRRGRRHSLKWLPCCLWINTTSPHMIALSKSHRLQQCCTPKPKHFQLVCKHF